jgi:hypothetical protein
MSTQSCAIVVFALCVTLAAAPSAQATLPPDQVVSYHLRENPEDPESPVLATIRLELSAVDQDASTIGWEITYAHFDAYSTLGEHVAAWGVERPDVATADGLWWVAHAHPEQPAVVEFATLPTISGEAPRTMGTGPDLLFDIAPGTASGQYQGYFGGAVAILTFALEEEGGEAIGGGIDEPCEVGD